MDKDNLNQLQKRQQHLKKKKQNKALRITLIVILSVIVVLGVAVIFTFSHFYSRSNFEDQSLLDEGDLATLELETLPPSDAEEVATVEAELEAELIEENKLTVEELPESTFSNIYNVLLIGVDRRERNWNGNSDAMILLTINRNTQKIYMTSFLRDLYANIEGVGVRKLNHAYAVGGAPLLINTLQTNYGVSIDNYAWVDFLDIEQIIDAVGGVELTVTGDEAYYVNDYLIEINRLAGLPDGDSALPGGGTYLMNGRQALAYSRIRYIGTDFQRTQRQRIVLQSLIGKARNMNVFELTATADNVLPYINHNLTPGETLSLITDLPSVLGFEVVEIRIPYDNDYVSQNEILIPYDINTTVTRLRSEIYATE